MAFVKKLIPFSRGKKKLAEIVGETSKFKKIIAKATGHHTDGDKSGGLSTEDDETVGLLVEAEKSAGPPMEDEKTADVPTEAEKTGLPMERKEAADIPLEGETAAGLTVGDNKTAGLPLEDNNTAGLNVENNKTAGLSMVDNKTAGLYMDNKTAGLYMEDKKAVDLSMENNKTAGLPVDTKCETELACFALGCFWFPESQFGCAPGVLKTRVGYTGGKATGPTHYNLEDHMEAVEITFDPRVTDYRCMLDLFWENHDPTRTESSHQHASTIFYHSDTQRKLAEQSSILRQEKLVQDILTRNMEAGTFYTADRDHQKYLLRQQHHVFEGLHISDTELITSTVACKINGFCGGNGTLEQLEGELSSFALEPEVEEHLRKIVSCGPLH